MFWHWYLLVVPGLVDKLGGSFLGIFALWGRTQAGFSLGPPCSTQYLPGSQLTAPGKAQEMALSQSEPCFVSKNEARPREVTMEEQSHCSPSVTTPCVPCRTAHKPLSQSGRAFLVQQTLPQGSLSAPGQKGWLVGSAVGKGQGFTRQNHLTSRLLSACVATGPVAAWL